MTELPNAISEILAKAREAGASDVHFYGGAVSLNIDGTRYTDYGTVVEDDVNRLADAVLADRAPISNFGRARAAAHSATTKARVDVRLLQTMPSKENTP